MKAQVRGCCPACGQRTLRLNHFGFVVCCAEDCPLPTALSELIAEAQPEHVVQLERDDFTVQHPLIERISGGLFACRLQDQLADQAEPPAPPGRYLARTGPAGLELTPTERQEP